MRYQKAPRVAEMSEKVCTNGHKGDWIARPQGTGSKAYCATCAKESIERHRLKKDLFGAKTPALVSKQQVEERWAKAVLTTAPTQIEQAQARLKQLSDLIHEAHEVVQKSSNDELIAFAFEQLKAVSEVFDTASK